jgi:hypothetical protein
MGNFVQDLRYAIRTLRKAPLFTCVAVLSLALGIGANTAIFTLVNQLILQLLPVRNPEQLVLLTARGSHYGSNTGSNAISYPMYQDFRDKNQVFQGMFCRFSNGFSLLMKAGPSWWWANSSPAITSLSWEWVQR